MIQFGWFFLAILSAVGFGVSGFLVKLATQITPQGRNFILFGLYTGALTTYTVFGVASGRLEISLLFMALGIFMGLCSALGNVFFVKALGVGPASLTGPLVNTNVVLVIIMSIVFFGERLAFTEVVGVLLLIVMVSLLSVDPNESISISDRVWYALILGAIAVFFVRVGGLKLADEFGWNSTTLLWWNYVVGFVIFGWMAFRERGEAPPSAGKAWGVAVASGFFSFFGLQLYAFALADGPAAIVAPIFSANGVVLAVLTIVLLGERLSRLQTVALVGVIGALVLLRLDVMALRDALTLVQFGAF